MTDSHPKIVLYDRVFDPLARAWFAALTTSPDLKLLLDAVPHDVLVVSLGRFNDLCHALMDDCVTQRADDPALIATVSEFREQVLWAGHHAPGRDAGPATLMQSIREKMKRNVSMGVVEALICLESALRFGRDQLKLDGVALTRVLIRSRQLYTSLAALHDAQEKIRLMFLTGIDGYLAYPEHDYAAVLDGRLTVEAHRFMAVGSGDDLRLRFVANSVTAVVLDSPVLRCPAHRLHSDIDPGQSMNDVLWDLLIDIYRRADRLA